MYSPAQCVRGGVASDEVHKLQYSESKANRKTPAAAAGCCSTCWYGCTFFLLHSTLHIWHFCFSGFSRSLPPVLFLFYFIHYVSKIDNPHCSSSQGREQRKGAQVKNKINVSINSRPCKYCSITILQMPVWSDLMGLHIFMTGCLCFSFLQTQSTWFRQTSAVPTESVHTCRIFCKWHLPINIYGSGCSSLIGPQIFAFPRFYYQSHQFIAL